jgi:hypothetical protein
MELEYITTVNHMCLLKLEFGDRVEGSIMVWSIFHPTYNFILIYISFCGMLHSLELKKNFIGIQMKTLF